MSTLIPELYISWQAERENCFQQFNANGEKHNSICVNVYCLREGLTTWAASQMIQPNFAY